MATENHEVSSNDQATLKSGRQQLSCTKCRIRKVKVSIINGILEDVKVKNVS